MTEKSHQENQMFNTRLHHVAAATALLLAACEFDVLGGRSSEEQEDTQRDYTSRYEQDAGSFEESPRCHTVTCPTTVTPWAPRPYYYYNECSAVDWENENPYEALGVVCDCAFDPDPDSNSNAELKDHPQLVHCLD